MKQTQLRAAVVCCVAYFAIAVFATQEERVAYAGIQATGAPHGWQRVSKAEAGQKIPMTIAIRQRNLEKLEAKFWAVSDPTSAEYGKHMNWEQVTDLVKPAPESLATVTAWLNSHGIRNGDVILSPSLDFITALGTVSQIEEMLQIELHTFQHPKGRVAIRSPQGYTLPAHIAPHVDFISDIAHFPHMSAKITSSEEVTLSVTPVDMLRQQAASNENGPFIMSARPGDGSVVVVVVPSCEDGTFSTGSEICNGQASVQVSMQPWGAPAIAQSSGDSRTVCNNGTTWSADPHYAAIVNQLTAAEIGFAQANTMCSMTVPVPNFVPLYTSARMQFASGNVSDYVALHDALGQPIATLASTWTTPNSLKALYGVPRGMRGMRADNSMSVAEFLGQFYSNTDLSVFYNLLGVPPLHGAVTVIGPNDESNPGGEASLDIQYILGVAPNIPTVFWSIPDFSPYPDAFGQPQEGFLQWVVAVAATANPPLVHSVSYSDVESSLPQQYTDRLNVEFQKLGVRGVTLLFASGDDGAPSEYARMNTSYCTPFHPGFPSASPYVTTVGGTQLSRVNLPVSDGNSGWLGDVVETMCDSRFGGVITSGGGFSLTYPTPDYQQAAVSGYLQTAATNLPPSAFFNRNGRGYPDVSAISHNYLVVMHNQVSAIHGTSASTPTFAAMVALLNELRLNANQPPLGFINPLLYRLAQTNPEVYNDITVGNNRCSANYRDCCAYGFNAALGWDPVTGLGSVNFGILQQVLFQQAPPVAASFVLPGVIAALAANAVALAGVVYLCVRVRARRSAEATPLMTTT